MIRNLVGSIYGWSSIKIAHSVPIRLQTWPPQVHLAKQFQRRRFFRNQPIRNKNCLWWPCLLTDRDEMSNLYRGPPIDVSYQVSVHLAKRFQRRRFLNISQSPLKPLSQMNRNLVGSHLWKVLYKDCSFCPDPLANMATTGNSCFWSIFIENLPRMLPTKFDSFGQAVSEEKIF
jgi:hypothetical protein